MTYLGYFIPAFGQNGKKNVHYILNIQLIFMWLSVDTLSLFLVTGCLSVLCYELYFPMQPRAKNFILCLRLCGKIQNV